MELWFAEQHLVVKALVVLLALPVFFFFMGIFTYGGMGKGSSEFPPNPTLHEVGFFILATIVIGSVVTLGAAILFGLIQLVLWLFAVLRHWTGW